MKKAIVTIKFTDGETGYFKNDDVIARNIDDAMICDVEYANGLCRGLNFCIKTYEDKQTDYAQVVLLDDLKKVRK